MYGSTISFASFESFFLRSQAVKNFFPRWVIPSPYWESIVPIYTRFTYDLTIAIINKCFEFQNDYLKVIRIRHNCTQFCPIPPC